MNRRHRRRGSGAGAASVARTYLCAPRLDIDGRVRPSILIAALSFSVSLLVGCGGGGDGSGGAEATTSTTASTTASSMSDGCDRGLVRCGGACLDIASNDANCGACGSACAAEEVCAHRACNPQEIYCSDAGGFGIVCGGQCVLQHESLDHCGGCDQPCPATSYCSKDNGGTCKPWQGSGTSCASPIVLNDTGNFDVDFWFFEGATPMALSCGAPEPRPTVTFRWTSDTTKGGFKFRIDGALTDDLVIEAFSGAPCGPTTSLGCNNNASATKLTPQLQMAVETGKTYFIVVGSMAASPPPGRFTLHLDD